MTITKLVNRIPAEPIVEEIREYLSRQEDLSEMSDFGEKWDGPLTLLAQACDVRRDTLDHLLRGRKKSIDFDLADKLMTEMQKTHLWQSKYRDIYYSVEFSKVKSFSVGTVSGKRMCAAPDCSETFLPLNARKVYCSRTCSRRHLMQKKKQGRRAIKSRKNDTCPNGHDRNEKNTLLLVDPRSGKPRQRCRICHNERERIRRNAA